MKKKKPIKIQKKPAIFAQVILNKKWNFDFITATDGYVRLQVQFQSPKCRDTAEKVFNELVATKVFTALKVEMP